MRILSIGNSFSVDAQTYAREIALAGGAEMELGNLYIGGCSLERHTQNVKSGLPAYDYYVNNEWMGLCAIQTALKDMDWDYVTVQQASHFSGMEETYEPFLTELVAYVRETVPRAQIVVHETWAYEFDSKHSAFPNYHCDRRYMHDCLRAAYEKAAERVGARLLPVGEAVRIARENAAFDPERGGSPLTRDGFHLSLTEGRFLAGAVWYEFFTSRDARENPFVPRKMEYLGRDAQTGAAVRRPVAGLDPDAERMSLLRAIAHEAVCAERRARV